MNQQSKAPVFIVLFLVAFFVFDRVSGLVFDLVVRNSGLRFASMYETQLNSDVLILGNSRGVNAFYVPGITKRLNTSAFNLSFNGLDTPLLGVLFADYCDRNQNPKLVLMEVTALLSEDAAVGLRFLDSRSPAFSALHYKVSPIDWYVSQVSHAFRYNTEIFLRACYFVGRSDQDWINDGLIDPKLFESWKISSREIRDWSNIKEYKVQGIREIVALCSKRKINLKLVISPYFPGYVAQVGNFQKWKSELKMLLGDEVDVLDYSSAIDDLACFADTVHLNRKGSERFLEILLSDNVLTKSLLSN